MFFHYRLDWKRKSLWESHIQLIANHPWHICLETGGSGHFQLIVHSARSFYNQENMVRRLINSFLFA